MRRSLTNDQEEQLTQQYLDGDTLKGLATRYGISQQTVANILERWWIPRRRSGRLVPVSQETRWRIAYLHDNGASVHRISTTVGQGAGVVQRVLREEGRVRVDSRKATGARHGHWKGGKTVDVHGYRRLRITTDLLAYVPEGYTGRYYPEHRIIMGKHLGRRLMASESVHHIDGDRLNNSIENLQLRQRDHGPGQRWQCQSCGSHDVEAVELT